MKKIEILNLSEALEKINVSGAKFNYAVFKNKDVLKPEVNALVDVKLKIIEKYAKKGEDGKFIFENVNKDTGIGTYAIKNKKEFEKEWAVYQKMLDEEVEIKLHKIKLSDVPETITTQEMSAIFQMIQE